MSSRTAVISSTVHTRLATRQVSGPHWSPTYVNPTPRPALQRRSRGSQRIGPADYSPDVTRPLPRAALLTLWLNAWLQGDESADELLAHLDDGYEPSVHVVVDLPGSTGAEPLALALGQLRARGVAHADLALPRPGDPAGLGGPPAFNLEALDAGEAVLLTGIDLALIPVGVGQAVEWRVHDAAAPPYVDRTESSTTLLQALHSTTELFVDLDVAAWQPDIPDLLLNRTRTPWHLPQPVDGPRITLVDRAQLCLELIELAQENLGGALSGNELLRCRAALGDLDRAARRVLIAVC